MCFVCDAPLRRYTPAEEPETDDAAKFEADLIDSMPEPVRKASERATATIAAIRNSAPPAVDQSPAAERKPAPRPRRADTRIYPGPAPEPAETTPAASTQRASAAPAASEPSPSATVVAGPNPPRRPRIRATLVAPAAASRPTEASSKAPAATVEDRVAAVQIAEPPKIESPAASAEASQAVEPASATATPTPAKPLAAADLSDPESSDKLSIAAGILSTAEPPEPRFGQVAAERIATAAEISNLKAAATPEPKAATAAVSPEPVKLEPVPDSPAPVADRKVAPIRVMPISASTEPQWRQELSSRVEAYRAKRRNPESGAESEEPQDSLPFSEPAMVADAAQTDADTAPDPRASLRLHARSRPPRPEKIEISTEQPELNFVAAEQLRPFAERLVPVAGLDERRAAGLLDAGFLLLSYAGFLALFGSLGGKFSFGKLDLLVFGATFFLFYVQYFALFTAFGGATPGMGMRGLRVVAFDGSPASARQLVWRSFGYVISAATLMLGFLWALWDEDALTWHDRMSQTYLTTAPPATADQTAT